MGYASTELMEEDEMKSLVRRARANAEATEKADTVGIFGGSESYATLENQGFAPANAYGQPNPYAQQNPYGQPQANPYAQQNPYGQPQANPYAQQNPYGQPQANPYAQQNPYGQPNPYAQQNPYGQPQANPYAQQNAYAQQPQQAPVAQGWICPACNATNESGAFCACCGTPKAN